MKSKIYIAFLTALAVFFSAANQTSAQTFTGTNFAIADVAQNSGTVNVSGIGVVANGANITLRLQFNHTFLADLNMWLVAPGGQVLELCTGNGGGNNNADITFSDAAGVFITAAPVTTSTGIGGCPPTSFAYNGTFRPEGRVNVIPAFPTQASNVPAVGTFTFANTYSGLNANGTWTLRINDHVGGDLGATCIWSVIFTIPITTLPCDQNFDGVTPPALPTNWTATTGATCVGSTPWATTNTTFFDVPNSAITNDPNCISDEYLNSPNMLVTSAAATMTFMRSNDLESTFDGMVLEVSVNGGAFIDVTDPAFGGSFAVGGYDGPISNSFGSPIGGRQAWTGNSGGFVTTTVNLPASANGQRLVFRWRRASDSSVAGVSAVIDAITFTGMNCACIITCPANIIVGNDPNQCGAVVTYPAPTFSGTCGTVTTSPASGSFFPRGTTTVTATATSGATCTFTVRVNDVQPPTITCPANITVGNTAGQCGAFVTFPAPTTTDNCPGVTVVSVPASGSLFPKGTTTVTSTATDVGGNTATCSFIVTVNDTQAPTITCPANITVGNTPGLCSAVVNYALPTVTDNCGLPGPTSLTQSSSQTIVAGSVACNAGGFHTNNSYWRAYNLAPMGLPGPLTINTVTFGIELADANGTGTTQPATVNLYTSAGAFPGGVRTLVGSQLVNIPDQTLSLFTATFATPPTVPANAILVVELFTPDGRAPANNRFFIGSNTAAQTGPSYISAADCGIATPTDLAAIGFPNMHIVLNVGGVTTGPSPLTLLSGLASGSVFPVGITTNTWRATDAAGNTSTCSFTVRVNDTQAPSITCPANIIATTPIGSCTAIVTYAVTATDNCPGVTVVRTAGPASGSAFPLGVTTITHVATDVAGNTSTCSFTVTVNDGQLPVISGQVTNKTACLNDNVVFSVTSSNAVSYQWQQWNGTAWVNITGATGASLTLNSVTLNMNTNSYRVNVIGLCTTITSAFATLYVNDLPTISLVASQSPLLIPGQSMSLTAAVSPTGGSIRWFKNGVLMSGVTSFTLSGLTVDDIGTYRAIYTDPNGCVKTSADLSISAQSTDKLWVYPNPTSGQFQVRFYNQANETITMVIYDSKGARVYPKDLSNPKIVTTIPYTRIDVDLSKNSSGSYIVVIYDSQGRQIGGRQVVIQH